MLHRYRDYLSSHDAVHRKGVEEMENMIYILFIWRLMNLTEQEIYHFQNCTDLKTAGMVRISFGIYNTEEEVDQFLAVMPEIMKASDPISYLLETGGGREYAEGELEGLAEAIPLQY